MSDDDLGPLLLHAARGLRRHWSEALEPWSISPHQFRALQAIQRHGGTPRLGVVAEELRVAPRSATDVIDSLEACELVRRLPDPSDRRATCVELTERGRTVLAQAQAARLDRAHEYFGRLDADEARDLSRLLRRLGDD